jgi:TetR/AcrR family transcriptional regulator, lmrAB and yxaGH operons repressor
MPRDQIIQTACALIERQGYHATGMSELVKESGSPRGSLYHYFPDGKEQIVEEAIERAGQTIEARVRENLALHAQPAEAVRSFVLTIAHHVEAADFSAGGPLQTVALETAVSSERINLACREAYNRLQQAFQDRLVEGGWSARQAARMAGFITAAIEGAILLSRTHHTGEPLRQVAGILYTLIETGENQ